MHVRDDQQDHTIVSLVHSGYTTNSWKVQSQHLFEANPYVPADERTQVADLKYRFEIGTLIQNPNSAVHYVLPVHVMAMRKNPPQTLIDAGYENFTFEQLRDEDQYATIPTSIRDKYFARKTYYFSINNSAGAPLSEHATFQPSIWAVYDKPEAPYGTEPLLEFDAFQIFQDDMPEYNSSLILVDSWAATEGQLFSESIPADLFVDPEENLR